MQRVFRIEFWSWGGVLICRVLGSGEDFIKEIKKMYLGRQQENNLILLFQDLSKENILMSVLLYVLNVVNK